MLLVWVRQLTYGVGLGPDPVHIISVVDNLTRAEGLVGWDGRVYTPMFPFTVSVVSSSLIVVGPISASALLNIIAFGISILILVLWLSKKIASRILIILGGIACAFSPLLGSIHASAQHEPLFILFVVTSLYALDSFLDSNRTHWLILSAVFSALSILTRYVGISLIILTCILLCCKPGSFRYKFKCTVSYLAIMMPILGVYGLRNFLLLGQFTEAWIGPRFSLDSLATELTKWIFAILGFNYLEVLPRGFNINDNILIKVSMLVILTFFVYIALLARRGSGRQNLGKLAVPLGFILTYTVVLYSLLFTNDIGSVIPRFTSITTIPAVVIFIVTLDGISRRIFSKLHLSSLYVLTGIWITLLAVANYNNIKWWLNYGYARDYYSSKDWMDSETISYLKSNPIIGQIYSNDIRAVYAHMPIHGSTYVDLPSYLPDDSIHWLRADNIDMYVIWFFGWKPYKPIPLYYDLMTLAEKENLQIVAVLEDGIIFKNSRELIASDIYDLESTILESILKDARLISADSIFDIYLDAERLIYISASCDNIDMESLFFLHIYPISRYDILESRIDNDLDFNNYDFSFAEEGFFFGENCAVIRNFPDYDIKTIRTGQYTTEEVQLWSETFQSELLYRASLE